MLMVVLLLEMILGVLKMLFLQLLVVMLLQPLSRLHRCRSNCLCSLNCSWEWNLSECCALQMKMLRMLFLQQLMEIPVPLMLGIIVFVSEWTLYFQMPVSNDDMVYCCF